MILIRFLIGMCIYAVGVFWCCTIIGIPVGLACFSLANRTINPNRTEVNLR